MDANLIAIVPILPSADIERDVRWYKEQLGFETIHHDHMYAVLKRGTVYTHLQWHADTNEDPLLGGSVVRFFTKNIQLLFDEMVK